MVSKHEFFCRSRVTICDMIKWNESDDADIAFEILAKKESPIPLFYFVLSVNIFLTTL